MTQTKNSGALDVVLIGAVTQLAEKESIRIGRFEARDVENTGIHGG